MKIIFKDEALSELYSNGKTEDRKYKKLCKNKKLVEGYQRAVSIMYDVDSTEELRAFQFSSLRKTEVHERTFKLSETGERNG